MPGEADGGAMSDDWRWTLGGVFSRFGWWFVGIGAAIAWRNKNHLPWMNS